MKQLLFSTNGLIAFCIFWTLCIATKFQDTALSSFIKIENTPNASISDHHFFTSLQFDDKNYICAIDSSGEIQSKIQVSRAPLETRSMLDAQGKPILAVAGFWKKQRCIFTLNSKLQLLEKIAPQNYDLDLHDFERLPNGNWLLLTSQQEVVDEGCYGFTSKESKNEEPPTLQNYTIIEYNTSTQKVVHSWESESVFHYTEASAHVDIIQPNIDYCHINSFSYIAADSSLLISSRNLDEVSKIAWPSGELIWRLGGNCNEFTFFGDSLGFSAQHQASLHGDTLLLFDNGTYHTPPRSSVLAYVLNESTKEATLLHRFYGDTLNFSDRRGGVRLLPNGNYLVCWAANKNYQFSELNQYGETLQKGYFEPLVNYRLNKGNWAVDILDFSTNLGDNFLHIKNTSSHEINLLSLTINGKKIATQDISFDASSNRFSIGVDLLPRELSISCNYEDKKGGFWTQQKAQITRQ